MNPYIFLREQDMHRLFFYIFAALFDKFAKYNYSSNSWNDFIPQIRGIIQKSSRERKMKVIYNFISGMSRNHDFSISTTFNLKNE